MISRSAVVIMALALFLSGCSALLPEQAINVPLQVLAARPERNDHADIRPALEAAVEPGVAITRIERDGDRVLVAVIERQPDGETEEIPSFYYATRTFRLGEEGEWQLVSPSHEAWGEVQNIALAGLEIEYHSFDDPYVRAVAPRIATVLPQMAADFGIPLPEEEVFRVLVTPFPAAGDQPFSSSNPLRVTVPSPLSPGFPLGIAQSPEEFLLGYMTDSIGHALLARAFGAEVQEQGRLALAHPAVQRAVNQAVRRDFSPQGVLQTGSTRTPLVDLLNPTEFSAEGNRSNERELFLRFAVARYGDEMIPAYLQAVFEHSSAAEVVQAAFGEDLSTIEHAWNEWQDLQVAAVAVRR